ncbi:ABC transporter [Candidatus Woesebacteria bacterium RIFCSPLOWO2_01_FULL_39_23]|uniref:ABC transporter n=1 Tax=Candidatus Woesebacteria bacterium RIFCSPHIGHO2_01_FULL_40_22 TaxID=1802499 RepID=A0A1F7YGD9_9BACT|nr:MAG: ABC transporter [Candidatus Woesebacteria bacterium RBG_16_40_11]OGM25949.1 MAG: ABC transporter [Candidatus Woesebacteria bacterium RIFCSPHIGHO2_01_FULL_40_22]OGM38062.1 MAG: ABC transporter [Candidatus Woesebacteria bacterium RIFCSPHIGHO2_12_FULL_38_9]OGM61798.1 MAG: ABC transporter [Candidatus Woesebacteria bacterium RIFCSPLOWO2_01_FULL_39_23]
MTKTENTVIIKGLTKNFDVRFKEAGLAGSIKSLIKPKNIVKRALKGISFTVSRGELIGFIGPNGAGKTTTLKILSGLLYPTNGFVQVLGFNPWEKKPEFLKNISLVMGQKNQLWWDLPAIESLKLNRAIYEISQKDFTERLNKLTDLLDVGNLLSTQVRKLSLGQRMRLEFVTALIHEPEILFLDEPTIGLDVIAQQKVRDFIYEYNLKNRATILLTSHNMNDLLDLTKRVIVIDSGEILYDGYLSELVRSFAKEKIIKVYLAKESDIKKFETIGKIIKLDLPYVSLSVPRESAAVAASEILQSFAVADLTIEEEPIEGVIRRVFKGEMVKQS